MTFWDVLRASLGGCPGCCLMVTLLGIISSFFGVETAEDCDEAPCFMGDCSECGRLTVEADISLPSICSRLMRFFDKVSPLRWSVSSFCRCSCIKPCSTTLGADGDDSGPS